MRLDSLTARLALALLATSVASGCVVPATLVEVIVETDMPGDGPFDLRVYAREGDRPFGTDTPARSNASINMVARYLRNGSAPSFVLVPRQGAARDGSMTARIEAESGETVLRRDVRFRFVPNQHGYLRIVLRLACALPDTRCRVVEPCTRQAVCEENGQTCGDNGACVSTLVAPSGTRPRPVGDEAVRWRDGGRGRRGRVRPDVSGRALRRERRLRRRVQRPVRGRRALRRRALRVQPRLHLVRRDVPPRRRGRVHHGHDPRDLLRRLRDAHGLVRRRLPLVERDVLGRWLVHAWRNPVRTLRQLRLALALVPGRLHVGRVRRVLGRRRVRRRPIAVASLRQLRNTNPHVPGGLLVGHLQRVRGR